ncbi:MAG: SDR family oxidoreductase [Gemmatimonadota bacterium]|nr:SDR family oxidoreductase [Gemmatimonadota bacterium]
MTDAFSLSGKRAVVTGGTRGIGAAVARLLARAGADVCVGYRSRHAEAAAMRDELTALGVTGASLAADIGTAAGANALVDHAAKELGGLEILVHSAGIWPPDDAPVIRMTDEQWARTMRENLDATFFVTRAAAAVMVERRAQRQGGGRIVLVDSTAGQRGEANHADYAASKGAMISFVKSVCVELAPHDITVNAVAPGWVDTEMCEAPFAGGGKERIAKGIPVGRIATPDDIAFPIVALCFDGARHVTGEIVNVNGGAVLCG